jgi:hypothetical protein
MRRPIDINRTEALSSVFATRKDNLRLLTEQEDIVTVARRCGYSSGSFISQLLHGGRNISEYVARGIEESLSLDRGWLDVPRTK